MSNKQQLQTNNTNLDALITRVNAAKDVAASLPEAGGLEVCNVTITSFNSIELLSYSTYENGIVATKFASATTNITLNNVICGSAISFYNTNEFNGFTHSHDSKYITHYTRCLWVLSAPTTPNVDATISIYDDD